MYDRASLRRLEEGQLRWAGNLLGQLVLRKLVLTPVALLLVLLLVLCPRQPALATVVPLARMPQSAAAQDLPGDGNALLIGFEGADLSTGTEAWFRHRGLTALKVWPELGMALVADASGATSVGASAGVPAAMTQVERFRLRTEALTGVRFATYDQTVYAADRFTAPRSEGAAFDEPAPADPKLEEQWSLPAMHVFEGWDITTGHRSIPIAVIDSGIARDHEDLTGTRLWTNPAEATGLPGVDDDDNGYVDDIAGWDWIDRDNLPQDEYGHGTHVTGIIGAETNNGVGIAGIAHGSAILPLRVLDAGGAGRLSDLIDAMVYARRRGVRILNLSLVLPIDSPALAEAVADLHAQDLIMFAATGNAAAHVYWPAAYPETVAVAAVDQAGLRASFSNSGGEVDLAAPGVDILSTYKENGYTLLTGTSMATANVSGLAAMIWALRPDLTRDELLALLQQTAVGTDTIGLALDAAMIGAGRVDFAGALRAASLGLSVVPNRAADRTLFIGEPGRLQMRVFPTGSSRGAAGAHLRYELIDPVVDPTLTPLVSGIAVTDADGLATIPIDTPEKPTDCILRVTVGAVTEEIALAVRSRPADLQLLLEETVVAADAGAAQLRVELRDAGGRWLSGDFPVQISATRGAFANGAASIEVTAKEGRATLAFAPGTTTGTAVVRAQVGDLHNERELTVTPGLPAQMTVVRAPADGLTPDLFFMLRIWDAFDNAVEDGTNVRIFVRGGQPAAETVQTTDGSATATVQRLSQTEPVEILILVPGTRLQHTYIVPPVEHRVWLPHVTSSR